MADTRARRYIVIDGKVKRIGINRDINIPEKATQKLSEMWVFLNQNNKAFSIQIHYVFLDEKGLVNNQPYEFEMVTIMDDFLDREKSKNNIISFPHKVRPPEKSSEAVRLFADVFIKKGYGTRADFNILLQRFLELRKRKQSNPF
ncbi:hypothetical protein [Pelosinus sp. sgz500959]|uniref:hypothetical protein n=1 Tax=Pelosinus sp. sgz500959 TaxID=3242472 RepID=UPI00366FEDA2